MPSPAQELSELEAILHNYTLFFLVFDVIIFFGVLFVIALVIRFIKSKKNLENSSEYLLHIIHAQEEERARIARELHDTVAQNLRYCKNLSQKKDAAQNLGEISSILEKSLLQVRNMSYNLAPPDITKTDFLQSLKNLCAEMAEKSEVNFRISILDGTDSSFLCEDAILNLYRIAQEAFTNVVKHAEASEVVTLVRNESGGEEKGLYIFISDDGKGFETENRLDNDEKHFGLRGMKQRSRLVGASFSVQSEKEEGTQITIFMPLKKKNYYI